MLAHAGLLGNRKATTHWRYIERLSTLFPTIEVDPVALYVEDGGIVTSAGSAAGLDMLLHLVRTDFGADIANRVAQRLVLPLHRNGNHAQLVMRPLPAEETNQIAHLMDWVRENLRADHTIASMSARTRMGPRTFQRRFNESTGL